MPGAGKFFASPVAGDGKVYILSDAGNLNVVKAASTNGDAAWEAISSRSFGERAVATPALVDGRIYLRTEAGIMCLGK